MFDKLFMMKKLFLAVLAMFAVISVPEVAFAAPGGDLASVINRLTLNTTSIPTFISLMAYIMGFGCCGLGLYKFYQHTEFGPQKIPLPEPLKYLGSGALLIAVPSVAFVVTETLGITYSDPQSNSGWSVTPGASGAGDRLDTMLVKFMENLHEPIQIGITVFCFIVGLIFIAIGSHRVTKTAQQGAQGPTGLGTIATFLTGGLFCSFAPALGALSMTLFGRTEAMTTISFMALESTMDSPEHVRNVISAILAFMIVVGLISIVRGIFIFRASAEGNQQATILGASSHCIAGCILVNFGQFANIIQNTLGVTNYGVLFN